MRQKIITLNRPISPHLSIYNPQITSLSSIWHRISGVFMVFIIVSFNILSKILFNSTLNFIFVNIQLDSIYLIFIVSLFLFLYHSLNGLRNILWSLSYGFEPQKIKSFFFILCFCLFCIFLINLI
uniref:succinate dehydrogenase subunit 3 n=1 Tax=Hypnea spinella TaxID=105608 RepID=UPI0030025606|nr:succinate dehydrogenase subunit 3 [Hypnea spinella]